MWTLKIAEGNGPWLSSTNNYIGRQYWEFDPNAGTEEERVEVERMRQDFYKERLQKKQSSDLLTRMQFRKENAGGPRIPQPVKLLDSEELTEEGVTITLKRAIGFYSTIQAHDGHWPAESAGPLFFLPPLVIGLYITGALNTVLSTQHQKEIVRYIYNHQNEDGGWGPQIEGRSTVFGSAFSYITLRLLGEGPEDGEDNAMARGRQWILDHGGAVGTLSWGKFWLTVLGVYDWAGLNPIPPEFWLLPDFFPIHPAKMMCYCRLFYMTMSYLYGKRLVGPITPLVQCLRVELYTEPYHQIKWSDARITYAKEDVYYKHPLVQDILWGFLYHFAEPILTRWPFSTLREKALKMTMEHIQYEDRNSNYIAIGCIVKVLSLIACWIDDPNSEAFKCHLARVPDYFWVAEDGLKMQSFGSQSWDAALAVQAILSSNLAEEFWPTLKKANDFIKASQVRDNPSGDFVKKYRHINKGCWTFSMQDHGWQVSDCTAEGLKAALLLGQLPVEHVGDGIKMEHACDAVNIILSLQSKNGGFPAWEPERAYRWMEKFNPTDFLEDVLIEREYVECTSSAIQALAIFKKLNPEHRKDEIKRCMSKGIDYIEKEQEDDGSWYGRWGICYTYGTWFAVEALVSYGRNYENSSALRKACQFLISKQLPDGGWGESYLSCTNMVYTNLEGNRSNLVQTSWALLGLIAAGQAKIDPIPISSGIRLLVNSQMEDGDFPQQEMTGIFMKNCTLNYSAYRNIFPTWALGEYRRRILFL